MNRSDTQREREVIRVIMVEGAANVIVLIAKVTVGLLTGSYAILGDALHSLTDVVNNGVALWVMRYASAPPDREHPYGHRKFETLAVFGLATLLAVLALEIGVRAIDRPETPVVASPLGLGIMLGVMGVNILLAIWQGVWARRLKSQILEADASHTLADVLTTLAVIVGWQLAAHGYVWLDTVSAILVAVFVMYLSWRLFRQVIPVLVDRMAEEPESLMAAVREVEGVRAVRRVRSRMVGDTPAVDVIITVAPRLSTVDAHGIADAVEDTLEQRFQIKDMTVHIEPDEAEFVDGTNKADMTVS